MLVLLFLLISVSAGLIQGLANVQLLTFHLEVSLTEHFALLSLHVGRIGLGSGFLLMMPYADTAMIAALRDVAIVLVLGWMLWVLLLLLLADLMARKCLSIRRCSDQVLHRHTLHLQVVLHLLRHRLLVVRLVLAAGYLLFVHF